LDTKTIKVNGRDGWPETTRSNTGHSPVLHKASLKDAQGNINKCEHCR